jgi:hypothetical protein
MFYLKVNALKPDLIGPVLHHEEIYLENISPTKILFSIFRRSFEGRSNSSTIGEICPLLF